MGARVKGLTTTRRDGKAKGKAESRRGPANTSGGFLKGGTEGRMVGAHSEGNPPTESDKKAREL